jgi:LuxR family transcriptional regulator, maltose regulon positive regulatory protein
VKLRETSVAQPAVTERQHLHSARFALTKFRPATLPSTLLIRSGLHKQLTAGAAKRLTAVVGSAGAGKSVLLSSWAAARSPSVTIWLSCDKADAEPVRFWTAFIEAHRVAVPEFGADAAELLAIDGRMSADVIASIVNDVAKLPAGSAIVVDDFHFAAAAVGPSMTDLVERWTAGSAQLVLAGRVDPPVRLSRLRMSGELREVRDRDLYLSLPESGALLANFGVRIAPDELALLQRQSGGWVAAVQMAALTLRDARDPARVARALDVRSHEIADYFISEVLRQQPAEVARFMLETSVLGELTAEACAAVTGRTDAAALLRGIEAANLFTAALDDDRTSYRYHHLVRQMLRAELHATDGKRELELQLRAAEWFESAGDARRATRHYLAAQEVDQALALLQERVITDFMNDPVQPPALDLSGLDPSLLVRAPERLLSLAADLLLWGDWVRGGEYLDLLGRVEPPIPPDSRLAARIAAMQSVRYALTGEADESVRQALSARSIEDRALPGDEWNAAVPMTLMCAYTWQEEFDAVDAEAAAILAIPSVTEAIRQVQVPGTQALAWLEAGRLTEAADAAAAAAADAQRLGFDHHPFAVDYLRALAGLALERRDLNTAEQLTERALSAAERVRPACEVLTLIDRAKIWAARGQVREALASIAAARAVLPGTTSVVFARADEAEAVLRLSLGDLRSPAEFAAGLPATRRSLLLAKVALAAGDDQGSLAHLKALPVEQLTPRHALERQLLLAAATIDHGVPSAAGIMAEILAVARRGGFLNTVVSTAPQVTSYLIENSRLLGEGSLVEQLISAAIEVRRTQEAAVPGHGGLPESLTPAELRVLHLLPTSTYAQMAAVLYVSRNTVKSHLRSIYQKLGVSSRARAIERAVDLRLL